MTQDSNITVIAGGEGVPPEPDWKMFRKTEDRAAASGHWRVIIATMREAGTQAVANGDAVERLCIYRVIHANAIAHVARNGVVIKGKQAVTGVRSRHWTVAIEAEVILRQLEAELGIAPLRRGKARKTEKRSKGMRPADAYITGKAP